MNFVENELNFYTFRHIVISTLVITVVNLCFELLNSNDLKETWVHLHCK